MYWLPLQIDIYKDIIKLNNTISIDTTDSIAQKLIAKTEGQMQYFYIKLLHRV